MFEKPPHYYTFILRFWQERSERSGEPAWRFTLYDPAQEVRYGFNTLPELVSFLQKRCQEAIIEIATTEEEKVDD
jgi:hypothetical protein